MKETFGQRFSRLRKQRGLTQEELGEKFGISGQAVSKWENDASMPDISILPELS
ncbi:MAG: helix-turn-helix transcriptional regulator, partial [Firmicutes bacterium]|nr:helix-turn-helix transcriptional regulator [Bacillota bacterium]